jgi:hypothetical protein
MPDDRVPEDDTPDERPLPPLPAEIPPAPHLEDRIVAELERRGLAARQAPSGRFRGPAWRWAGRAAAALAIFLLGWAARGLGPESAPAVQGQYALFLYEDSTFDSSAGDLVEEYGAWARALDREGRLVWAERLADRGTLFSPSPDGVTANPGVPTSPEGVVTGLFVVRAASPAEAEAIARAAPHLRHGGRVAVRAID